MHSTMDSLQSFNPLSVPSNPLSKSRSLRFPSCPRDRSINPVLLFTSVPVHHARFDPLHLIITSPNNKSTKIYANSSRKQDSESSSSNVTLETTSNSSEGIQKPGNSSNAASASNSHSSSPPKKEKKWKNWWRRENRIRWEWKPIGENQDVGFLLLQLAVSFLAFWMLRLGNSFPSSEQVNPISVPYSQFLSKINNNQVQKVEVDGVHIMFKLKSDQSGFGPQLTGESTRPSQQMEEAIRSAASTKRILYTTTRPTDIKTPYEKMLENRVEFGSPDKQSARFWNSVLVGLFYVVLIGGFLQRFSVSFSMGIRKGKNSGSGSSKTAVYIGHPKPKGSEKAVVAWHEAGHAVVGTSVANLLPGQPRVEGHLVDMVQKEVKGLLQSALEVAFYVIKTNPTVLVGLVAYLEEKEKVEGEELQQWLKLVGAPLELAFFIRDKHENFLQLETSS